MTTATGSSRRASGSASRVVRSVPTMQEVDLAPLHQMAAGIVGDHGVRHAVLAKFPRRQAAPWLRGRVLSTQTWIGNAALCAW